MKEIFNKRRYKKDGKVSKVAVSYWNQKYFTKTLANFFKNTCNMCGAGLQPGTYFTCSFIF